MATSLVTLVTFLFIGAVFCQSEKNETESVQQPNTDTCIVAALALQDDGFDGVKTKDNEGARKKRGAYNGLGGYALGGYGVGGYALNGYALGDGCGAYPAASVNFMRCFHPGNTFVQRNHIVRNYYRAGTYDNALGYFRALPLVNVAPVASGYVGHFTHLTRSYTVNACNGCFNGYSGISVRCDTAPYNYLVRNFIFQPGGVYGGYAYNGCNGAWC